MKRNIDNLYTIEPMEDGGIRCSSWNGKEEDIIFEKTDSINDLNKLLKEMLKKDYDISVIDEIE